jgi:microcystin degradation protein MlrC
MSAPTDTVKKYKVAFASFEFEGNDFSPKVCGRPQFGLYAEGEAVWDAIGGSPLAVTGGVTALRESGVIDLTPLLVAQGGSGGTVERSFYERTVDTLLDRLRVNGPFAGLYLALHGAMTSPGVPDAEGDLLARVRAIVGPHVPIAVSLDLHAHVTPAMAQSASILVGYENYPHDDAYTTGIRACRLLVKTLRGELKPVIRMQRLNMLVPVVGGSTLDPAAPLAKLKHRAREMERQGVESISYFTCQPWLDDDRAGNVVLAITHDDAELAERTARLLADQLWDSRDEFELPLLPIDEAIRRAIESPVKPVLLADTGDSVGAGATGDSAYVLAKLLALAPHARCGVSLVDAAAARLAIDAGVGATVRLKLGFGFDPRFGEPLAVEAKVAQISQGDFVYSAGPYGGTKGFMGPSAVLHIGLAQVLVTTQGSYEYADEQFRSVGIDPATLDVLVLKNGMNFRNLIKEGTRWYLIDSVGSSSSNLGALPWRNRRGRFWPRERDMTSYDSSTESV